MTSKLKRTQWTDEKVEQGLKEVMHSLSLSRMPTADELKSVGRNDLHSRISRFGTYRGWAGKLGVDLKESHTNDGQEAEFEVAELLRNKGYIVEHMTTRHPYDLLIDGAVKIDVKMANEYFIKESRVHTFNLVKNKPTCDIYIMVANGSEKSPKRTFVVPSHHVQQQTVSVGVESSYDVYDNDFDIIRTYSDFYKGIAI